MSIEPQPLSQVEQKAIVCICVLAAYADGVQDDGERAQIERIVNGFSGAHPDLLSAYQDVLGGKLSLPQVTAQLQNPSSKALAYEMAVCVCHADGVIKPAESQFLAELKKSLQLDNSSADAHLSSAQALVEAPLVATAPPVIDSNRDDELNRTILNAAILSGALEMMPHSLATMAIVPVQMQLVYRIGKRFGFDLDRGHIKDFLATMGIGLTSQVFEGFTERLVGNVARGLAGRLLGGLAGQAAGSAFGFATTYALGQVAKEYYASGRTLSTQQLKEIFSSMLTEARSIQGRYSGEIAQKSRQINISQLLPLVRQ